MCKQDTESVKVALESVLRNRGNLEGTHLTRFSPGGYIRGGGYLRTSAAAAVVGYTAIVPVQNEMAVIR